MGPNADEVWQRLYPGISTFATAGWEGVLLGKLTRLWFSVVLQHYLRTDSLAAQAVDSTKFQSLSKGFNHSSALALPAIKLCKCIRPQSPRAVPSTVCQWGIQYISRWKKKYIIYISIMISLKHIYLTFRATVSRLRATCSSDLRVKTWNSITWQRFRHGIES